MSATAAPLGQRVAGGFLSLGARQAVGALIALVGGVTLARWLGPEALGAHAVAAFFINLLAMAIEFGTHQFLIRAGREELTDGLLQSVSTLRLGLGVLGAALAVAVLGPLTAWWYGNPWLSRILIAGVLATAVASPFRVSLSLLEKDMHYTRVGAVELLQLLGFYVPAVVLVLLGVGMPALVAGEIGRGLSGAAAFALRPFRLGLGATVGDLRSLLRFGGSYLTGVLAWMSNAGVSPLVVGTLAGLEVTGHVRVAEGLAVQGGVLKGIGDRIVYPALAEVREDRERVPAFVTRWRLYQLTLGVMPLFALAAVSPWAVPLLFGEGWSPVAPILVLLALGVGLNSIFGVYSAALVTAGQPWKSTKAVLLISLLMWLLAPPLVVAFGGLGYPLALVLSTPAYLLVHRYFVQLYGPLPIRRVLALVLASWGITLLASRSPQPWAALAVFILGHGLLGLAVPEWRRAVADLPRLLPGAARRRREVPPPDERA
jgi:PST family polysaccharide transporter